VGEKSTERPANLYKNCTTHYTGVPMKKEIFVSFLLLLSISVVNAGFVPRVVIQSPHQAKVFLHPPICETRSLPPIPNRGVIYAQVYTFDARKLYIEFNGQPIYDEFGDTVYNPKMNPESLEIIPIYIEDQYQRKACYIMARAENENGANTVYAAFIPIPTGNGKLTTTYGCTTMY
jgi:hypothetical protein